MNASDKIKKKHIQTTEQITLSLITKIRQPQNPLHNLLGEYLYERTQITKITERLTTTNKMEKQPPQTGLE